MIGLTRGRDATWGRANGAAEGEGLSAAEPGHKGRVAFGAEAGWRVLSELTPASETGGRTPNPNERNGDIQSLHTQQHR